MPRTDPDPPRPVMGYFAYWIDRLRRADELPSALADRLVRAAIHEAPPACRPSPVEAWLFAAATDHGDGVDCAQIVGWLRLRAPRDVLPTGEITAPDAAYRLASIVDVVDGAIEPPGSSPSIRH